MERKMIGPTDSTQVATTQVTDELAVRHLFQALNDAWTAGDAIAYGALFTADADYLAFDGANQKGRAAIIAAHKPLFENFLKGSRLTGQIVTLRFLTADIALLHTLGNIVDAGRTTAKPERLSSQTLLAVKEADAWRFRTFHNTRVRPIGNGLRSLLAWAIADIAWRVLGPKA